MSKGFSIKVTLENVEIQSFLTEDYDRCYFQNENFDFLLEGVLLNKKKLMQESALSNFETYIKENYHHKKQNLIKDFEGEFRGFIYDRSMQKLCVFTNPTSTQKVFYTHFGNHIFVDTSLIRLQQQLKKEKISTKPHLDALYQLLAIGNMLEGFTPIDGVHKLLDGHFLEIDCSTLNYSEIQYYNVETERFSHSKKKAMEKIHEVFSASVAMEYEKDIDYNTHHLSLLSGGLDSRVALFYAMQNGFTPDNVLCFSQSDYFDESISRKIAEDYQLHYEFIALDGGYFLKKIDQLTEISEGLGLFTGGLHVQYAVDQLQYQNFKIFHSGQIGDGILGGFLSKPETSKPSDFKVIRNHDFKDKIMVDLEHSQKKYEREETFLLRNLAFNRTVLGAEVLQQKAYQTSPFMTKDLLQLSLSLPEEWKFEHRFYIEWISKYCKEATHYRWERTLLKPNAAWKTKIGDQFVKRAYKILNDKILRTPQNASMYPYQFYYDASQEIQEVYDAYFNENLSLLDQYKELQNDVIHLFEQTTYARKSEAINILSIFKLYFSE